MDDTFDYQTNFSLLVSKILSILRLQIDEISYKTNLSRQIGASTIKIISNKLLNEDSDTGCSLLALITTNNKQYEIHCVKREGSLSVNDVIVSEGANIDSYWYKEFNKLEAEQVAKELKEIIGSIEENREYLLSSYSD